MLYSTAGFGQMRTATGTVGPDSPKFPRKQAPSMLYGVAAIAISCHHPIPFAHHHPEFTLTADIPALIGPLSIGWGEITSDKHELRSAGTMPAAGHVIHWRFAETRLPCRAAQGRAK